MSYSFRVSEEFYDLLEVDYQINFKLNGHYSDYNQTIDGKMHYNVGFTDKRYAAKFLEMFQNVETIKWDESDDEEIVTIEELQERGWVEVKFLIAHEKLEEFYLWCKTEDFATVDQIEFFQNNKIPCTVYMPAERVDHVFFKLKWDSNAT